MMKEYTITEGQYDSYYVVARVQGPDRPSIKTLFKQFDEKFDVVYKGDDKGYLGLTLRVKHEIDAERRVREAGYGESGSGIGELFVDWLVKERRFTVLPRNEFHIPR